MTGPSTAKGRVEIRTFRILTTLKSESERHMEHWNPQARWNEGPWHTFVPNYKSDKHAEDISGACDCLNLEAQEKAVDNWQRSRQLTDEYVARVSTRHYGSPTSEDEELYGDVLRQDREEEAAERREKELAEQQAREREELAQREREAAETRRKQELEQQLLQRRQEIQTAQLDLERREQELGRREESLAQCERDYEQRQLQLYHHGKDVERRRLELEGRQRESEQRELDLQERTRSLDQRERAIDLRLERAPERVEEDVKPRIRKVEEEVPGDAEVRPRVDVDIRVDGGRDPVSGPCNVEDRLARLEEQLARLIDNGREGASSLSGPSRKRPRRDEDASD
jgi:DNA repair exonuclease SbcCD ATPase subunit